METLFYAKQANSGQIYYFTKPYLPSDSVAPKGGFLGPSSKSRKDPLHTYIQIVKRYI